jgi:thiol-disulfide isomerase/thioredoxin
VARRTGILKRQAGRIRLVGGALMIVVAVLIGLNVTDGLQRVVPGYTTALQNSVEQSDSATKQLHQLTNGGSTTGPGTAASGTGSGSSGSTNGSSSNQCSAGGLTLVNCGPAPELTGITGWLNSQPLTLNALRGKVVLIDFWTYSCINCQRTLPHVEAWYRAYQSAGLEIIGVHTPEFAFEHVTSNISAQAAQLGVRYPVAIDNDYGTWNAYSNQYWPAEFLIDRSGVIRHVSFGEGEYAATEELIRQLLGDKPNTVLPNPTEVADTTPTDRQTAETYLGYQYAPLHTSGTAVAQDAAQAYQFPAKLDQDTFALAGTWTDAKEMLTAGPNAKLELSYQAKVVYLVLGGTGTITVQVDGRTTSVQSVSGVPKLYTLVSTAQTNHAVLTLSATPGVQAYDFTFG